MRFGWFAQGPDLYWFQVANVLENMNQHHIDNARNAGVAEDFVEALENDLQFLESRLERLRRHYYAEDLHD